MFGFFRSKPSDLRLAVEAFLANVPPGAPIRAILSSPEVEGQLVVFDKADAKALRKQASNLGARRLSLWAGFVGALVAGFGLLPLESWLPSRYHDALSVLRALSLILTLLAITWLSVRQSGARWMRERGRAEKARADFFSAVMQAGASVRNALPQALACFTRAHLERQLKYFASAKAAHEEAIGLATRYRIVGTLVSICAGLLALATVVNLAAALDLSVPYLTPTLQWLAVPQSERWQAGLSAMAASILAFASARASMDRSARNVAYYGLAISDLQQLKDSGLAAAEASALAGQASDVLAFTTKVQQVLSLEHRAWQLA
jgi:hypothetical protein